MHKLITAALLPAAALGLAACDVEQTDEGEALDVEVSGELPEYDVDTPDVEFGTEERTVEVPTMDIEEADADEPGE